MRFWPRKGIFSKILSRVDKFENAIFPSVSLWIIKSDLFENTHPIANVICFPVSLQETRFEHNINYCWKTFCAFSTAKVIVWPKSSTHFKGKEFVK